MIGKSCCNWRFSLNYIKQNGLKDNLHLLRRFSIETFLTHEYDMLLVTIGHGEGLYVFGFLLPLQDMFSIIKALLQPSNDEMTQLNYMQFPIK